MKTKEILSIIIVIALLFIPSIVNATTNEILDDDNITTAEEVTEEEETNLTWTDVSNIKFEFEKTDAGVASFYRLNITDVTPIKDHTYYVFIMNGNAKPEIVLRDFDSKINTSKTDSTYSSESEINYKLGNISGYEMNEFLEKNGDIYCYIVEEQENEDTGLYEQKFIVEGKKINRPAQNKLTQRIIGYFFNVFTDISIYEPNTLTDHPMKERNVNIKIGKVKDNSILLSIKNGNYEGLEQLLEYAKKSDAIYTGTAISGTGKHNAPISSKMEIVDGEYYFAYLQLDDENGTYYPVEDVELYQGKSGNLLGQTDSDFKWNIQEENKTDVEEDKNQGTAPDKEESKNDGTTAPGTIPQTGESITIFIVIGALVVLGTIGIIKFRKNNF